MAGRMVNAVRQFNHQARLFFVAVLGLGFAIDGVYTVLLNLYLLRLNYGTEFIGLVNAVGLLAFAFTSLPAGILGTRLSNTRMMKIGAGMILAGGLLLPLVEYVPSSWQASWFVIHYALMLAGFSFFFVNGAPFLMNIVDSRQKNDAFAIKNAHLSLAAFVGSLVGGIVPELITRLNDLTLDDPAPYRITLMIVSVVLGIVFLLILNIRPLPVSTPGRQRQACAAAKQPSADDQVKWALPVIALIGMMTLIRLLQVAGAATAVVYFNVYMDAHLQVSTSVIGAIAALGRLTGVPAALIVPRLVRRWGNANVVLWGSLVSALFLIPLALVEHWLAAATGFIGILAVMSLRYTAFVVYILDLVPKVQQSVMAGSGEMAAGFSFALMAMGGGIILSLFTFRDLFLVGAMLSLIGTAIFWWHCRKSKPGHRLKPAI